MRLEIGNIFMKGWRIKRAIDHIVFGFVLTLISIQSFAQSTPIFGWRSHFSYNEISQLAIGNEQLFASTTSAAFFIDQDQSLNFLNKNNALSDIDITAMASSSDGFQIVIGYESGQIDMLVDGISTPISDIKNASNLTGKRINAMSVTDDILWVATDFGMVKFDLTNSIIDESYRNIGQNGSSLAINDFWIGTDSIFVASDDGILSVSLDDRSNRQDFNFWQRQLSGIPFDQISLGEIDTLASSGSDLFLYVNGAWEFYTNLGNNIREIKSIGNSTYILTERELFLQQNRIITSVLNSLSQETFLDIELGQQRIYIGTASSGLLIYDDLNREPSQVLPSGPKSDHLIASLDSADHFFWLSNSAISKYDPTENNWSFSDLNISGASSMIMEPKSFVKSIKTLVGNYTQGPYVSSNSGFVPISNYSPDLSLDTEGGSYKLADMTSDSEKNIWFLQQNSSFQLHRWDQRNDVWNAYQIDHPLSSSLEEIFIIDNGNLWMSVNDDQGGGIIVFDPETGRERYLNINGGQGGLPGSLVNDIVQDQDRFIWVATDEGVGFYPNPDQILNGSTITASVPIFENSLLLRDQHLTSISIDPANRKWFGTLQNGTWLFSETGESLIHHFTVENSPLPSNEVMNISIDESTGHIYFTSPKGIVSFRSDATVGGPIHESVKIYPNPINRNKHLFMVIEGLVNNAELRITDVSGKLVKTLRANGSTATWDIRTEDGAKPNAGVYLILSSNSDGSETYVGKIVIN